MQIGKVHRAFAAVPSLDEHGVEDEEIRWSGNSW